MYLSRTMFKGVLLLAFAASSLNLGAAVLTPEQALARVNSQAPMKLKGKALTSYKLSYTAVEDGQNAVYVFSQPADGKGYFVLSADDCADAVLGYSDSGNFDAQNMPEPMVWWLGEYARQIAAARNSNVLKAVERPERKPIEPMLKTTWNQDAPYNMMCPLINGQRSMTGCVATAMAQIVNYHQWPVQGVGSYQYFYNNSWISLDYSKITFDWANMLDSYADGAGNERQKTAVAQLMYACGVSVDMQYSPAESGAADLFVASGLVDHFNYDVNVRYAERDYFGLLDWEEFIYNQLTEYGPVQYSGSSSIGGHSFVCDGYSEDGYFHINWGWGGVSDAYFRLTALDPPTQGIGGSTDGFNFNQAIIGNISKPREGSEMYVNLMMDQGFTVSPVKTTTATRPGDQITIPKRVINYSIGYVSGALNVKFVNTETGEVKYGSAPTLIDLPAIYPLSSFSTQIPSNLKNGTYELSPVVSAADGEWRDVPVKLSTVQKVIMTVRYGNCTFEDAHEGNIEVTDVELHTPVYLGNYFQLTATVSNPGNTEFVGQLVPTLATGSTPIAKSDPIAVDILPGESTEISFNGVFNHFATSEYPAAGKYTLYIVKEATNEIVSEGQEVELHAIPETTTLTVDGFKIDGDPEKVDPSKLKFVGTVNCTEGYLGRNLTVVIFPYKGGNVTSVAFFSTPNLFIEAGESAEFTAGGVFGAAEEGQSYFAMLYDGQTAVTTRDQLVIFTIPKTTGITDVEADANSVQYSRVYNLSGVMVLETAGSVDVSASPLANGVYLLETVKEDGTKSVERVYKK